MRSLLLIAIVSGAAWAQSMVEFGAVTAGAAVGSVAGKQVSAGITSTFSRTGGILDKAAKTKGDANKVPIPQAGVGGRVPTLQVSPGVPKSSGGRGRRAAAIAPEPNNVPLPPPAAPRTSKAAPRAVPMPVAYVVEPAPEPVKTPLNVDLSAIAQGTPRADVLALGGPSARITMFEDGHLVEIYNYRNESLASGSLRLIDGAVSGINVRP